MTCGALAPLKQRRFGKSRLAGLLDEAARATLDGLALDIDTAADLACRLPRTAPNLTRWRSTPCMNAF
ncbi:MAG TPA: hypothetical protein PKW99_16225 [Thauera sp.]|nr:hypothetical protein [Thauera sp.]